MNIEINLQAENQIMWTGRRTMRESLLQLKQTPIPPLQKKYIQKRKLHYYISSRRKSRDWIVDLGGGMTVSHEERNRMFFCFCFFVCLVFFLLLKMQEIFQLSLVCMCSSKECNIEISDSQVWDKLAIMCNKISRSRWAAHKISNRSMWRSSWTF